jgi:competence ComEA-like helix-hairpin-helix protein
MFTVTPEERAAITWVCVTVFAGILLEYGIKTHSYPRGAASINEDVCKIRLNSARYEELITVKGVGKKLAQRIIEYRAGKGSIDTIQELAGISGMTAARLKKIEEAVILE